MKSRSIRVLVVDHNPLMREELALLVRLQSDMQLVAAAATAEETVCAYAEQRPDVTLMDLDLPASAAIEAIRRIRALDAGARIIGLSDLRAGRRLEGSAGHGRLRLRRERQPGR